MATKKKPAPQAPVEDHGPPLELCEIARRLALLGIGPKKTAMALGVSEALMTQWIRESPRFAMAVAQGQLMADSEVVNSLYRSALGYTYVEEVAVKVKDGQHSERVDIVELKKEKPADVSAAMFWLINRHPDKWRKTPAYEGDPEQLPREITIKFVHPSPQQKHLGPTIELTARGHADD